MTRSSPALQHWLVAAIGAGLVSGVTLAAFAAFAETRAGLPVSATYAFLAASVGGSTLADGPAAVPIGVLVLFGGTLLWAFGYLYAAQPADAVADAADTLGRRASASSCGS